MEGNGNGQAEDPAVLAAELGKTLKEGEKIQAPTRRPDGTLRKAIRIRAGYVSPDQVAKYQSKGAIRRKEMSESQELPPGYDQVVEPKTKSKAAKRNERKKEKRQQVGTYFLTFAVDAVFPSSDYQGNSGSAMISQAAMDKKKNSVENDVSAADNLNNLPDDLESLSSKMDGLSLSVNNSSITSMDSTRCSNAGDESHDIDKKIRALKKKIRLSGSQKHKTVEKFMNLEQLEMMSKLGSWPNELKLLEDKKAAVASLS